MGDSFDDTESFVSEKVFIHALLPVLWHWGWLVANFRSCRLFDMDLHCWARHAWKGAVRAYIEDGAGIPIK